MNTANMVRLKDGSLANSAFIDEVMTSAQKLLQTDPTLFQALYDNCMNRRATLSPSSIERLRRDHNFVGPDDAVRCSVASIVLSALWDHGPNKSFVLMSPRAAEAA